ncbi:MAG: cation:proton antiporter, partial [Hyphomicrobiales bacterium]|nr:cation:proton antiporter [Hyphomicrobiales bacterium]
MEHNTPLISTVVVGLVLAFILGLIAQRIRVSPLVGYLAAGVLMGPFTPGFVADQKIANELAEIGIILLMFGVGLHFSLKDLLSVKNIAVPGAVVQITVATLLGIGLGELLGWSIGGGGGGDQKEKDCGKRGAAHGEGSGTPAGCGRAAPATVGLQTR